MKVQHCANNCSPVKGKGQPVKAPELPSAVKQDVQS